MKSISKPGLPIEIYTSQKIMSPDDCMKNSANILPKKSVAIVLAPVFAFIPRSKAQVENTANGEQVSNLAIQQFRSYHMV